MYHPDHHTKCIFTDSQGRDLIDLDDLIEVDPYNREPSSRKSDKSLSSLLSILDNLQTGKDGK